MNRERQLQRKAEQEDLMSSVCDRTLSWQPPLWTVTNFSIPRITRTIRQSIRPHPEENGIPFSGQPSHFDGTVVFPSVFAAIPRELFGFSLPVVLRAELWRVPMEMRTELPHIESEPRAGPGRCPQRHNTDIDAPHDWFRLRATVP